MEIISSSLALLLVLLIICKGFFSHSGKLPPAPPSIPILGHIHLLTNPKKPLHLACQTLSEKYGPILFLRFGFRPVLLVSSPSEAEQCLTLNDRVFANRPNTIMGKYAGYNKTTIGSAPIGEHWRNLRRITTIQIFCNKSLQMSSWIREQELRFLFGKMFRSCEGKTQKVKFTSLSYELSYNAMTRMTLGKRRAVEPGIFKPTPSISVLDFLPVLRWVGYKGIERKAKESQTKRDLFLQGLLDEFRRNQKGVSGDFSMDTDAMRKPIFELLLSLQEEEPDLYPDSTIKGVLLVSVLGYMC
ncbi:Cytochrome P450 [Dillenia turbinata]|uniref:Cytochrome P450 n=1 Tax=Dillenia turbinata TaxID=194707 RepID=A0AAN8ZIY9_9MAGN